MRTSDTNDTIVAISTPPGRGGIGIVRLSGPQSLDISSPLLRLRHPLAHAQARLAEILDTAGEAPQSASEPPGAALDQAVVTFFAAPNSYTGEDLIEIAAHGSPVVLDHIVRQCIAGGARLAEPGEFTQRAFLAGRIDLTQAEAVRDLIDAHTLHQARVAARQMGGALANIVRPIKEILVGLIATLEAGIDFAEDDVDVLPNAQILEDIAAIRVPLEDLAASFNYGRLVHDGLTLAIAGRPNVGKSSLFNRLVERDRAIVTAVAGTTRDTVTERVSIGGIPVELVDTAGLRAATSEAEPLAEAEAIGIGKSREAIAEADLVLLVLDATQPLHQEEQALISSLADRPSIVVRNKADLAEVALAPEHMGDLSSASILETSALTGHGIPELRNEILAKMQRGSQPGESGLLTNLRQQQAVQAALEGLDRAEQAVAQRIPHEMLLLDIYSALRALDSLTGETTADDILNLIFSSFCIGK
ncbi:MAG: tRNA uridine-5-carboxymethylaminomethyl(34) synthesis GTPase MnmE [Acidobacteriaceae bacterium]